VIGSWSGSRFGHTSVARPVNLGGAEASAVGSGSNKKTSEAQIAVDGSPPGFRTLQLAEALALNALEEVRMAPGGTLELGHGFTASRELYRLRKFKTPRAARRSWEMKGQRRFEAAVAPLAAHPDCAELLSHASSRFGLSPELSRVNVIVRHYRPGDWLGRHVDDFHMFDEPVLSCILRAGGAADGLRFSLPPTSHGRTAAWAAALEAGATMLSMPAWGGSCAGHSFVVSENMGVVVCLERDARYVFGHEIPPVSEPRVSMTWRWLRSDFLHELEGVRRWMADG